MTCIAVFLVFQVFFIIWSRRAGRTVSGTALVGVFGIERSISRGNR